MGTINGNVSTFGASSADLVGGRVKFIPSSAAVTGTRYLLTDQPIGIALIDGTGAFSTNLVSTVLTRPATYYSIVLETPDPDGGFKFFAEIPGELRVPTGAGPFDIVDIFRASANPAMVYVGETYPYDLAPPSPGVWWADINPSSPNYGLGLVWED